MTRAEALLEGLRLSEDQLIERLMSEECKWEAPDQEDARETYELAKQQDEEGFGE